MDTALEASPKTQPQEGAALAKNKLGIAGIVFFVVAAAAPLVGMTGAVPVAIVLGNGAAVPGTYLAVGLLLLVFAVGFSAMSHRVANTGAFFAFVGRGLGIVPGVGTALVSLLGYIAIQLAIYGFFGALAASTLGPLLGLPDVPWWVWTLIAWAAVLVLSLLQVDIGAKVLGVLMLIEVGSLLVTAVVVLIQGGGPDGLGIPQSFAPSAIFAGGFNGSAGIALAFAFASYIGFEATAIYGEESKNPKRTVPIATYVSISLITILFTLTSWAVISGLGTDHIVDRVLEVTTVDGAPLANPAAALFTVASQYVGPWLSTLMSWLVLTSLFAGLVAFQNNGARYLFSLGRGGVLPKWLDKVNRRQAPAHGAIVTAAIAFAVIVIFALAGLDPFLNLFSWFSGVAVLAIMLVEILVSVSIIAFFRRDKSDRRLWNTLIAPLIATVGLCLGVYLIGARFNLLAGTAPDGVDPTTASVFELSPLGWLLVLSPVIVFAAGAILGVVRHRSENRQIIADFVS